MLGCAFRALPWIAYHRPVSYLNTLTLQMLIQRLLGPRPKLFRVQQVRTEICQLFGLVIFIVPEHVDVALSDRVAKFVIQVRRLLILVLLLDCLESFF